MGLLLHFAFIALSLFITCFGAKPTFISPPNFTCTVEDSNSGDVRTLLKCIDISDGSTPVNLTLCDKGIDVVSPNAFNNLTNTLSIDLSLNSIRDLPASLFVDLSSLTTINLSHNNITTLPNGAFDGCGSVKNISLVNNTISSIEVKALDEAKHLLELNLCHNNLGSISEDIFTTLPALTSLSLCANQLPSIPDTLLHKFANISKLDISYNKITALSSNFISENSKISEINAQFNEITAIPDGFFKNGTPLTSLQLNNNKITQVTVAGMEGLRLATGLETLSLEYNQIKTIDSQVFSDGWAHLNALYLHHNLLSSITPGLFKGLGNITSLRLDSNHIPLLETGSLEGLGSLIDLNLSDNNIAIVKEKVFDNLVHLSTVRLANNSLTTLPPFLLHPLASLSLLDLSNNSLVNISTDFFEGCGPSLRQIYLNHNQLAVISTNHIAPLKVTEIKAFGISDNKLQCCWLSPWLNYQWFGHLVTLDQPDTPTYSCTDMNTIHKNLIFDSALDFTPPCSIGRYTEWSEWDTCSCLEGASQSRYRNCTNPPPTKEGTTCDGDSTEIRNCTCT
eukprot:Ihof_evm4s92 gene=Ihof_evmTU4s92